MTGIDPEAQVCQRFLERFQDWVDPTWGYYVYAIYTSPPGKKDPDEGNAKEITESGTADDHFQAILSKVHAHVADNLHYSQPGQYSPQLINTLRLQPAAYLPGASLADVCTHFRDNYAIIVDSDKIYHPGHQESLDDTKCGPKYSWCIVIDDKALQSIENGPEPVGTLFSAEENVASYRRAYQASKVFVKLLSSSYTTMNKPKVVSATARGGRGRGRRIEWEGWLKFSPVELMRVFDETASGDIKTFYRGPDKLLEFD